MRTIETEGIELSKSANRGKEKHKNTDHMSPINHILIIFNYCKDNYKCST